MNESLQKIDFNVFDSIESEDEHINLKTIIIPGLKIENESENLPDQVGFSAKTTHSINDEIIIESAEDIFIFTKPGHIVKKETPSGLTQIPTTFENGKQKKTTSEVEKNIFLNNEKEVVTPLKPKTRSNTVTRKKAGSTKREVKQPYRTQKSYGFAITSLFLLIIASILFILHLNDTINLQQIGFDLYKNSTTILSSYNENIQVERWGSFISVEKIFN